MSSSDSGDARAVLNRLRYGRRLTFEQYLEYLAALDAPVPARPRVRGGPPFDLIGRVSV